MFSAPLINRFNPVRLTRLEAKAHHSFRLHHFLIAMTAPVALRAHYAAAASSRI